MKSQFYSPNSSTSQSLNSNPMFLSNSDRDFITRLAKRIQKSGFVTPAIFFLEMTKPLALLGSHAMVFFGPIINAFIQADGYYRAAELFEEPDTVEFLLSEIERLDKADSEMEGEPSER
ncbi:MAG: hypothetical protein ACE5D0_10460 [Fidelibacterota bacterium]